MSTASVNVPARRGRSKESKGLRAGEGRKGFLLVLPTLVFLALIIVYPLLRAVQMSFQKDSGLDRATGMFVEGGFAGLGNYSTWILQRCGGVKCAPGQLPSQTYSSLWQTLFFAAVTVALETVIGIAFAMIMNANFRGRGLVRAAILVPWAIPTAVTAKLWYFIFAYDGIANHVLGLVGIKPLLWTGDAWPARFAIIIADTWKTTPFMALLILAGLQLIPAEVYEAASIDGASKLKQFTQITLPLVKTPLMVAVLFRTLDALRMYDLPAILTGGGGGDGTATTTLSMLVVAQIQNGFHSASALSTLVFLLIALVAFLFIRFGGADIVPRPPRSPGRRRGRTRPGDGDQPPADEHTLAGNMMGNLSGGSL